MSQEKWEELQDRMEVSRTLYGYAHGVDRRDWPAFRDCFCDEVEIDLSSYNGEPPVTMPLDDWVESVRSGLSGFDATQHISANHLIEIDGDRRAVGIKNVSINEQFFQGHYPGTPIMPGVLIVEAMAQTAGAILGHNFRSTEWYEDSYKLLTGRGLDANAVVTLGGAPVDTVAGSTSA